MKKRMLGCLILVALVLIAILVLFLARACGRPEPQPPPTDTPTPTRAREEPPPARVTISPTPTRLSSLTPTRTPLPEKPTAYDLYVRRMDYTPAEPVVGETITLHIMIATDTHPSDSPLFPASRLRWRKGPAFAWVEEDCPTSTQYATCTPIVTFSYAQPGEYLVEVEADSRKEVAETNENNNVKSWSIVVKAAGVTPTLTRTPPRTPTPTRTPPSGAAPLPPINCRVRIPTSGSGQVFIDWDLAETAVLEGFRIYQGRTSLEATVGASQRSVLLSGLTRGVQYHFDVRAYNAYGESRVDACSVDVTPPR